MTSNMALENIVVSFATTSKWKVVFANTRTILVITGEVLLFQ